MILESMQNMLGEERVYVTENEKRENEKRNMCMHKYVPASADKKTCAFMIHTSTVCACV